MAETQLSKVLDSMRRIYEELLDQITEADSAFFGRILAV